MLAIIMSTYNRPVEFERALQSIFDQTYKDWHLYVVHDGNCNYFTKNIDKITYMCSTERANDFDLTSKNIALDKSVEPLIAHLDDNNEWYPNHLEKLVYLFDKYPEIGFAFSSSAIFSKKTGEFIRNRISMRAEINNIDTSEIMHKRTDLRWRKSEYTNDWDYISRIAKNSDLYAKCTIPTVKYWSRWE